MSDTNTARDHLLGYCLAATTNEVTCAKAEELADAYRDEVLAKAAERLLPPWEAVYDSATFTPYLLAYCNDETAAKGAAEEWLRQHCADAAGLAWTPDPVMAGDEWEQWLTLTQTSGDGTVLATEIVVRRRAARTTTAQED